MGSSGHPDRHILPGNARPIHYDLKLEPDFTTCIINGSVGIELDILENSNCLTINAVDINVLEIGLRGSAGNQSPKRSQYDEEKQTLKIEFENSLPKGSKATLSLKFEAVLNDKGVGFYRSSYVDESGAKKYMACTQLAPIDARRAFPCFDEPALKATYDITLISHEDLTCLSNMNILSEERQDNNKKCVKFARSPPMSTYIVAMVIGDLEHIETTSFRIPVRIYTTPGLSANGHFALYLAARTLKFYEEAFDSPFPLPKMDMVAVHDAFGAMENWGLVTYMRSALLLDSKTTGAEDKKRVSTVVQHELAHQWFGNLVTMEFWDGLWLNEGFATWMSWYSTNAFYPEWNIWQDFVTGDLQKALGLDSLRSSHPVEVPVQNANDINQIFDAISYSKGSCVIRMLAKSLGEDIFLKGIQAYLKEHAFQNTETKDLWESLSTISGKDVAKEMSIWTGKVGFPVVTVTELDGRIRVRQDRFLQSKDLTEKDNETIYPVSLGLITTTGREKDILLDTREMEIPLKEMDFFKLNASHSGFYRTLYTPERLMKFGKHMQAGLLSVEDRIGLIADASALASSGHQKTSAVLGLLAKLKDEKDPFVWRQIISCLNSIKEVFKFEGEDLLEGLRAFTRDLVAPRARALGWDFSSDEVMSMAKHKAEMFKMAGEAGDPKVVEAATQMFAAFAAGDRLAIHPNIRTGVYAVALKQNDGKTSYEGLLSFYQLVKNTDEARDTLIGLGNIRDPVCMQSLLDLMLSEGIKAQDFYLPMISFRKDAVGVEALWKWAQKHWEDIEAKLYTSLGIFGVIVGIMLRGLSSKRHLEEIDRFLAARDTSKYDKQLALVLDSLKANVGWVERDREDVEEWLKSAGY